MRRCLILRQGASPLKPPNFPLDREWPSHGSRDRETSELIRQEETLASFAKSASMARITESLGTWPRTAMAAIRRYKQCFMTNAPDYLIPRSAGPGGSRRDG